MTPESVFQTRVAAVVELLGHEPDEFGFCQCPGQHLHTKKDGERHFRVFALKGSEPHGYCFHTHCQGEVAEFNRKLQALLLVKGANLWLWDTDDVEPEHYKRHKETKVDEQALAKAAADVLPDEPDMLQWLESVSPWACDGVHGFLSVLYPNDRVLLFTEEKSQGQLVWNAGLNRSWESAFRTASPPGAWFQIQPVTGNWISVPRLRTKYNQMGRTRRAAENVTEFRYLLLESDCTDLQSWCRVLVQLPMPIVSVTTSGSRSLHALVYVGAKSRAEWENYRYSIETLVGKYGCDQGALKAVQLSRLPGCLRHGSFDKETGGFVKFADGPRLQRLLFLDPGARGTDSILKKYGCVDTRI